MRYSFYIWSDHVFLFVLCLCVYDTFRRMCFIVYFSSPAIYTEKPFFFLFVQCPRGVSYCSINIPFSQILTNVGHFHIFCCWPQVVFSDFNLTKELMFKMSRSANRKCWRFYRCTHTITELMLLRILNQIVLVEENVLAKIVCVYLSNVYTGF